MSATGRDSSRESATSGRSATTSRGPVDREPREATIIDVPARLLEAVAAWDAIGRPAQAATEYDKAGWLAAFPAHGDLLRSLPARLNRADTRRITQALLERGDVIEAFLVSQIWGYGRRGYGPYRVRRILDRPEAEKCLRSAYLALATEGPVAAFEAFADEHRIAGLGPSFFTKFIFFADQTGRAVVLDEYVGAWLAQHAAVRIRLHPARSSVYRTYLTLLERWAAALKLPVDAVEQLIFAAEAVTRPRNDWVLEEVG